MSVAAAAIESGNAALRRSAWAEARAHFEAALASAETPEALEGLGAAARWLLDGDAALDAHERGYRLARRLGDERAAARLAIELAFDSWNFRGAAEANGWLERAGQLLDRLPLGEEHAYIGYLQANIALSVHHDPQAARTLAAEAVAAARAVGSVDYEMSALAMEGLALVSAGEIDEGMRRLDAATAAAVAGEIGYVRIAEVVCCHLIDACKRVRDLERAGEWALRTRDIAARHDDAEMFATCRCHYGEVLVWRGAWDEADRELSAACAELARDPAKRGDGPVRLAELRRHQGRPEEALALLAQAAGHPLAALVRGALALDRGDPLEAAEEADRFLRRAGEGDLFARVPGLELCLRARLALGELEAARAACGELRAAAAAGGTPALRAAALLAEGRLAAAEDRLPRAREALEDAVDLLDRVGARHEAARARMELAQALRALGREAAATAAEAAGLGALAALGAAAPSSRPRRGERGQLTPREREVLTLLARGLTNEQIAAALVLSVRTVEHHVASVYVKIGASGRAARAAATAYALGRGLA